MSNIKVTFTKTKDHQEKAKKLILEAYKLSQLPTKQTLNSKFLWVFNTETTEPIQENINKINSSIFFHVWNDMGHYIVVERDIYYDMRKFIDDVDVGTTVTTDSQLYGLIK